MKKEQKAVREKEEEQKKESEEAPKEDPSPEKETPSKEEEEEEDNSLQALLGFSNFKAKRRWFVSMHCSFLFRFIEQTRG